MNIGKRRYLGFYSKRLYGYSYLIFIEDKETKKLVSVYNIYLGNLMNAYLIKGSFILTVNNKNVENTGGYMIHFMKHLLLILKYISYAGMETESQCLDFIKQNIIPKIYEKYFN